MSENTTRLQGMGRIPRLPGMGPWITDDELQTARVSVEDGWVTISIPPTHADGKLRADGDHTGYMAIFQLGEWERIMR